MAGDLDSNVAMQHMMLCAHASPQPKRHVDRLSHVCTDDRGVSLYFRMGRPFPLKIAGSHGGSAPHLIHGSLGQPESSTEMASRSVQPFL